VGLSFLGKKPLNVSNPTATRGQEHAFCFHCWWFYYTKISASILDKLVKNRKVPFFVIPADPGSEPALDLIQGPGQALESSILKELQKTWTPFFNGVTKPSFLDADTLFSRSTGSCV
jgi:hypothetical protein